MRRSLLNDKKFHNSKGGAMRSIYRYLTAALTVGLLSCPTLGYSRKKNTKRRKKNVLFAPKPVLLSKSTQIPAPIGPGRHHTKRLRIRRTPRSSFANRRQSQSPLPCRRPKTIYESSSIIAGSQNIKMDCPLTKDTQLKSTMQPPNPLLQKR